MILEYLIKPPYLILTLGFVILFLFSELVLLLKKRDLKKDYSCEDIQYYTTKIDGIDYLIVPYMVWEIGKLKEIKNIFSNYIEIDNNSYKLGILYDDQKHIRSKNDLLPQFLYRDCIAQLYLFNEPKVTVENNNINNTYVNGNNNQISINQNHITNTIKNIINEYGNKMTESEKQALELFLYRIQDNTAKKDDAKKVIDILSKFLPLTTALISLIKSIFF